MKMCIRDRIIYDFFDALKSRSRGYASFDYEMKGYEQSDLVKDVYKRQALSFASIAAFTFLTAVLTPDLIALFLSALVLLTKILFLADLMLAMILTSYIKSSVAMMFH